MSNINKQILFETGELLYNTEHYMIFKYKGRYYVVSGEQIYVREYYKDALEITIESDGIINKNIKGLK